MPAAWRTISAIGQYVIPSPYWRQRPESTRKSCAEATSSAARRDLPTPGSPTTVASCGLPQRGLGEPLEEERELRFAPDHGRVEAAGARAARPSPRA